MSEESSGAKGPKGEIREVVGVFGSVDALQAAIDGLLVSGFDRSEISLLEEDKVVRATRGSEGAVDLEDDNRAPRSAYIETESLSEGKAALVGGLFYVGALIGAGAWTASSGFFSSPILAGAVTGAVAGVAGLGLARLIGNRQAKWARAQVERGGLLLWVRTWTEQRERQAMSLMQQNGGHHVHVHAVAV
jgi:hypothetical protein